MPMAFWVVLGCVGVLCLLGLIMVLSVTTVKSTHEVGNAWFYFNRQLAFVGAGSGLLIAALVVGHRRIAPLAPVAMGVALVGLVTVLFVGREVKGSTRWFSLGSVNVQPSEIAKVAIVLWAARLLAQRAHQLDDWRQTLLPIGVGLGVTCLLIKLEPDLGTVLVLCTVVGVMLVVAGARVGLAALAALPVVAFLVFDSLTGYHADRWGFLDPLSQQTDSNYQLLGSLSSVASGGWFGVGPGASTAKWGFLPEAHTDAIFAVIAEEMGIVGALIVIAVYLVLLGAGMRIANDADDLYSKLLAIGISCLIAVQAFVNIGVSVGALPNKGFTLPFVSYGGSSLLVMMFGAGLLLSIAKDARTPTRRPRARRPKR